MAASLISFHCIICVEPFSPQRPPVVLNCGHTFLCKCCAERMEKCHECRASLFLPQSESRLPMPTNYVLLSMMEAAERISKVDDDPDDEEPEASHFVNNDDDEEESFTAESILAGMGNLSGPCGTYAVRDRNGLCLVSAARPPRTNAFSLVEMEEVDEDREARPTLEEDTRQPCAIIEYGQTVQVVAFENGVATLARGNGFVTANRSQLVKVGDPKDVVCRLEGLLGSVVDKGQALRKSVQQNEKIQQGLKRQIEAVLAQSTDYPVVTEAPCREAVPCTTSSSQEATHYVMQSPPVSPRACDDNAELYFPTTPQTAPIEFSRGAISHYSGVEVPASNSIDNSDMLTDNFLYSLDEDDDDDVRMPFGCGSAFGSEGADLFADSDGQADDNFVTKVHKRTSDQQGQPSQVSINVVQHAQPSVSSQGSYSSSSFDGVDFRTGLSGHGGLSRAKKRGMYTPRRNIRMMGEHRGIAPMRMRSSPRTVRLSPSMTPIPDYALPFIQSSHSTGGHRFH